MSSKRTTGPRPEAAEERLPGLDHMLAQSLLLEAYEKSRKVSCVLIMLRRPLSSFALGEQLIGVVAAEIRALVLSAARHEGDDGERLEELDGRIISVDVDGRAQLR